MTSLPAWQNPVPRGRYHLLIVGAGPAGLVAAETAVRQGARVALIERNLLGGTCLNSGCIPSKTIIRTSRLYREMRDAELFGGQVPSGITVDFPAVMERVRRVRARLGKRVSAEQLVASGIDLYVGEARFAGPGIRPRPSPAPRSPDSARRRPARSPRTTGGSVRGRG